MQSWSDLRGVTAVVGTLALQFERASLDAADQRDEPVEPEVAASQDALTEPSSARETVSNGAN